MIILLLLSLALLINYIYFLSLISSGLKKLKPNYNKTLKYELISVIIPFRNEQENIEKCYRSVTNQSISEDRYEVIFIDDNSDDESFQLLEQLIDRENVIVIKSPVKNITRAHKKNALKNAIENAKGELIITTDADCSHGKYWLENMQKMFDNKTAFVSGPVQFSSNSTLFEELQALEFSSLIIVGAGLIGINNPIICNAANLGFRKSVYFEVGGYEDNLNVSSGDDEFLMQKIHRKTDYKIKFCFNKDALVLTEPNKSVKEFYQQRKRWASKGFHYVDKKITFKLILIFLFYLGIPCQLLLGIFYDSIFWITFFLNYILKIIWEYKVINIDSGKLFNLAKLKTFLIAELFHIPYIIISGIAGLFGNYEWKDRTIKR